MDKFRLYKNYAIIGIISLFCLFFLPFTGSVVGMDFILPNTPAGWIVYIVNKIIVATVNFLILYCFVSQGKMNIKDHPNYIKAYNMLLENVEEDKYKPKSPKQHSFEVYGKKGVMIFITTIIGLVSLGQAVLTFDFVTMLTYFFVITTGIIFGVIQMGAEENYWTDEFLKYAIMITNERKKEQCLISTEKYSET